MLGSAVKIVNKMTDWKESVNCTGVHFPSFVHEGWGRRSVYLAVNAFISIQSRYPK